MSNKHDDPVMAEAIARRDESRAQILRSKAAALGGGYKALSEQASKQAVKSGRIAAGLAEQPETPDPEGTAPTLADSAGNFAANAEVAATGGIGVDASNTNVHTGKPAAKAEDAGVVQPQVDLVPIPEDWQELSWQERRSLAAKFSDKPVMNGDDADKVIKAELKRRG